MNSQSTRLTNPGVVPGEAVLVQTLVSLQQSGRPASHQELASDSTVRELVARGFLSEQGWITEAGEGFAMVRVRDTLRGSG